MSAMRSVRKAGGFTLLEAVVTLVIVSMLIAMLMQALSQSLGLRTRMLRLYGESREMLLQEAWFRESVGAAQPPVLGPGDAFDGEGDAVSYMSAAPLVANGSARVRWWLATDEAGLVSLNYADPDVEHLRVLDGLLQDAAFSYRAAEGEWRSEWQGLPPARVPVFDAETMVPEVEPEPILPRLVRLQAVTAGGRRIDWVVHLSSDLRVGDQSAGSREMRGDL
ncbi:type II secretion system protein [Xanthomonas sp. XNM01]|nr:type II secretion system protein [Xanthomonas sp. XNM01]